MTKERDTMQDRLSEIRGRLERATEGPWEVFISGMEESQSWRGRLGRSTWVTVPIANHSGDKEDAEFLAHSRSDIPYLLGVIEELSDPRGTEISPKKCNHIKVTERKRRLAINPKTGESKYLKSGSKMPTGWRWF